MFEIAVPGVMAELDEYFAAAPVVMVQLGAYWAVDQR